MTEKFFWADQIADKIIKEKGDKEEYVCASGITPSGTVHIGNFREVITTELVVRALRDRGKKVRFIYSWDDYDRFREVPANLENAEKYKKYIGRPLSEVPSPSGKKSESYAQYFEKQFEKALKKVYVWPEFIRQNEMNKKCKYAGLIKLAIEKRKEIMKILNKYRKEPLKKDWMPISVYCEKCKKDFTQVLKVDGYVVEYECKCGFKDKIDFRKKGIVKVLWRVDWPMRWKYEQVDFEPGGKDHSAYGGSFMTAKEIIKQIFDYEIPLYIMYEWVKIKGGQAFSSSTGNAINIDDVEEIYEPEVLRYLFVGTRPNKGFQISFDNDVIKLYEDFDALEEKYYSKKANPQEKRIYELSKIDVEKKKPARESFRHLITLVQIGKANKLKGHSKVRAEKVKNWLDKYAGDDMKFEVQEKINVKLDKDEKVVLKNMLEILGKKDATKNEKKLTQELYEIPKRHDMAAPDFFRTVYRVIINKEKGPRLAVFIIGVGKEKVIKLLRQVK